jgi:hypothetical protein
MRVLAQVDLCADEHARHAQAKVAQLRKPRLPHARERRRRRDAEADEEHVRLWVGERAQAVAVPVLACARLAARVRTAMRPAHVPTVSHRFREYSAPPNAAGTSRASTTCRGGLVRQRSVTRRRHARARTHRRHIHARERVRGVRDDETRLAGARARERRVRLGGRSAAAHLADRVVADDDALDGPHDSVYGLV